MWITPVTNRKQYDVDKVKSYEEIGYINLTSEQKAEWLNKMIGALNDVDVNRIENNQEYIARLVNLSQENKKDWTMTDIFGVEDSRRVLDNLKSLLSKFELTDAPQLPELPLNVYTKINDIEKLLLMMYEKYFNRGKSYFFITNDGKDFLTDIGEEVIVHDIELETIFMTNDGKDFFVNEGQYIVFKEKI